MLLIELAYYLINLDEVQKTLGVKAGEKMYATFDTTMGMIVTELYWDKAPNTVINFVQLAEGTKEWTDPKTSKKMTGKKLYDGTIFHRVIADFSKLSPLARGNERSPRRFELINAERTEVFLRRRDHCTG